MTPRLRHPLVALRIPFVYVIVDADELTAHAIDATGQEFDSVAIERP